MVSSSRIWGGGGGGSQDQIVSHGVHMAAILAAILDFHENQFLRHFDIPHQRKIIEHASLG